MFVGERSHTLTHAHYKACLSLILLALWKDCIPSWPGDEWGKALLPEFPFVFLMNCIYEVKFLPFQREKDAYGQHKVNKKKSRIHFSFCFQIL